MATFIPYEAYKISEKYTEPCNSCFKKREDYGNSRE